MTLTLQNVCKIVDGVKHIKDISLTLETGSMNVLLGPTSSGKTSLMRLMAGLDHPSTGQILWKGNDVSKTRVQDRDVAMVYQQFINYPSLTVFDNIASPLKLRGLTQQQIKDKVHETAELLQLTSMLDRKPLEISGGQQQRCALARALVKNAGLVLMDEPLANLDYKLREELRKELPKIFADSGAIFVYATTEPDEALLLGGNTATLWDGYVTQFGLTPEIYRLPNNKTTATVFSDPPMNFLSATKNNQHIIISDDLTIPADGIFADIADGNFQIGFRPNHLMLTKRSEDAITFETQLSVVEITGSETYSHVNYEGQHWISLRHGIRNLTTGQALTMYVQPQYMYLFSEQGELIKPARYALKEAL